jgi:hypothetical protein
MKLYCLVENDSIIDGPRPLPDGWRNISGLNCLTDEELKTHGWLPASETIPTFDSETEKLGGSILDSILEDEVIYTKEILTITNEEQINKKISEIVTAEYAANRAAAIVDLKGDGTLPPDYED